MSWERKVHVASSLPKKEGQFALFIGRWQPLHDGHKNMFQQAFNEGKNVLIAIRNMPTDDKNPFTPIEVRQNIINEYQDLVNIGKVEVIVIPDICSVEFGRGVGYDIIEHIPPQEIAEISATKIREEMRKNNHL